MRVALVLHAHLPWLKGSGTPSLEERWFFDALWECYAPLYAVLSGLGKPASGRPMLGLSLSPTLLSMLRAPDLNARFVAYAAHVSEAIERVARARTELADAATAHLDRLRAASKILERLNGDLVSGFVALAEGNVLELMTTAATHAFLPGLRTAEAVRGQVRMGMRYFQAVTKRTTSGFWLPECGYDDRLEATLVDSGAHYTVLASHGVELARPRPPFGTECPILGEPRFAYFGRDTDLCDVVWSPRTGYPANPVYREFHVTAEPGDPASSFKPYSLVGRGPSRAPYDPRRAEHQAIDDARDFVSRAMRPPLNADCPAPIRVAAFDAELFGHWWWEGPTFLREVLHRLDVSGSATSLMAYLESDPLLAVGRPATSTWGQGGYSDVWTRPMTSHTARTLHRAERRVLQLDALVRDTPRTETQRLARLWAIRELFLLQASDYAFMIKSGEFEAFATRMVREHADGIDRLADIAERPTEVPEDRPFVDRWMRERPVFDELDEDAWADAFDAW